MAMAMASLLLLVLLAVPAVHSLQYTIDWSSIGTNYQTWAAGKTFTVGDAILFVYTANLHAVDIVTESDYNSCNSGNALESYTGGNNTITLTTAGPMYFICPMPGHCLGGMKLSITVVAAAASSSGASSSSSTTSTTPAITTTTSSPKSSAGGNLGNVNSWVIIGFSVVVAGLVGFMG